MGDVRKAKIVFCLSLLLIFGGLGLIWSSRFYFSWHMESGSDWLPYETKTANVSLNSATPSANYSIREVMLNVTHFNVSEGRVSLLIYDENDSLLLNRSEISGNLTVGYTSREEIPDSNADPKNFTLLFLWEGTNTTASFAYKTYRLISWDGVPYVTTNPGYYEFIFIGSVLILFGAILFVWAFWSLRGQEGKEATGSGIHKVKEGNNDAERLQNRNGLSLGRRTFSSPLIMLGVLQITRAALSFLLQYRIFMWGRPHSYPGGEIFAPFYPLAINPLYLAVGIIDTLFMSLIFLLESHRFARYLLTLLDVLFVFSPIWFWIKLGFGYTLFFELSSIGISILSLAHLGILFSEKLKPAA